MPEHPAMLGLLDEPQQPGAVVAVNYGDYRRQQIAVRSGANIGNWCFLGGEFGVPRHGTADLPLHPTWQDVLAQGPVTLLSAGSQEAYESGGRTGADAWWSRWRS